MVLLISFSDGFEGFVVGWNVVGTEDALNIVREVLNIQIYYIKALLDSAAPHYHMAIIKPLISVPHCE